MRRLKEKKSRLNGFGIDCPLRQKIANVRFYSDFLARTKKFCSVLFDENISTIAFFALTPFISFVL